MTSGDASGSSASAGQSQEVNLIQTSPGTLGVVQERIPLPPPPPISPPVVDTSAATRRWVITLEGLLVVLLLVFAFLIASFKASNPDLFLHLAVGRAIAAGQFTFGSDPFSFASQGIWVQQAWLFDLLLYLIYSLPSVGEVAVVVVKALGVSLTGWLLYRAGSQPDRPAWIPLSCAFLAVLALSPRALLSPPTASMLLLAILFFLLVRGQSRPALLWAVPVVCWLWVNVDAWFFLGPIAVGLFLLGQILQDFTPTSRTEQSSTRSLAVVFAVSLLACCCNPYHVWAFTVLPPGLLRGGSLDVLAGERAFRGYFLSPFFDLPIYFQPTVGLSAAGLAFWVLLLVSLASFVVQAVVAREQVRWWRVLLWLGFILVAASNIRGIPYFAIVAGPITALNFLEVTRRRQLSGEEQTAVVGYAPRWSIIGRVLTVVVVLVGILVGIPGWLQASPQARRTVGWGIEADRGLEQTARQIAAWREQGVLPEAHKWFNLSPDVSYYLAWFAPGERAFIDARLELFSEAAADFATVRKALSGTSEPRPDALGELPPPAWRRVFRERGIRFLIFHDLDLLRQDRTLELLYSNPDEFIPCHIAGSSAVFAWQPPAVPGLDKSTEPLDPRLRLNFVDLAFGKEAVPAPVAPSSVPGNLSWWEYLWPAKLVPAEALTAGQHLKRFQGLVGRYGVATYRAWISSVAGSLVGRLAIPDAAPLFLQYQRLQSSEFWSLQIFSRQRDAGPPESLYLAVRAARSALAVSPEDEVAQLLLAQSYFQFRETRERTRTNMAVWTGRGFDEQPILPHVRLIRQVQTVTALRNALQKTSNRQQQQNLHFLLSRLFGEIGFLEPQVTHSRKALDLLKQSGPPANVNLEQFGQNLKILEEQVQRLEKQLRDNRNEYEVQSVRRSLRDKALLARQRGLIELAVNLLSNADVKELADQSDPSTTPGALLIELLLLLGRIDEAMQALTPSLGAEEQFNKAAFGFQAQLGVPGYEWFRILVGAATGDYASIDQQLADLIGQFEQNPMLAEQAAGLGLKKPLEGDITRRMGQLAGLYLGSALLQESQLATSFPWQILPRFRRGLYTMSEGAMFLRSQQTQLSDLLTLRAWLALEAGQIATARQSVNQALDLLRLGQTEDGVPIRASVRALPLLLLLDELLRQPDEARRVQSR